MRIVHTLFNMRLGGTETMLLDIMPKQVESGHDVTLILINKGHDEALMARLPKGVKVVYLKRKDGSKNPWHVIRLNVLLYRLSPDVVHVHNVRALGMILRRKGIKTVFTAHCLGIADELLNRADSVCAISEAVKADLKTRYAVEPTVIYNGIDTGAVRCTGKRRGEMFRIVQVGRMFHETKGQDILLHAVSKLREQGVGNACIDFIGDGASADYLKGLAKSLGLDGCVRFLGARSRQYIYDVLCDYDLMVQPSRDEGFGLTVAEGMAAKVPVLISNLEGPMEVIGNGEYGEWFNSGDADACAEKIKEIISDYARYEDKAVEAYGFVTRNFDISGTAGRYVMHYETLSARK